MVDRLSLDNFYPDCPVCDTNVGVDRSSHNDFMFKCHKCGQHFNDDFWGRLMDLPPIQRQDFIGVEIRGRTQLEQAKRRGVKQLTVKSNIDNAKEKLYDDPP